MASDEVEWTRTIIAIIAAATVVTVVLVLTAVWVYFKSKRDRQEVEELRGYVKYLDDLDKEEERRDKENQYETIDELMKPYKKALLSSAFALQSRLSNQITDNFLYDFTQKRTERDKVYALESTEYLFAEFLAWLEVIRYNIVFVTGAVYAESLNQLLDSIRFQFSGELPIQGCAPINKETKKRDLKDNNESFDVECHVFQLYAVDLLSIGRVMLEKSKWNDGQFRPIPVDVFRERRNANDKKDFQETMEPLSDHVKRLGELHPSKAPTRRLAILQVLLCKLIAVLDDAVPYGSGTKLDAVESHEEPQYIERNMRLVPLVPYLSATQRSYLESMVFFEDDPNLSFPGFCNLIVKQVKQEDRSEVGGQMPSKGGTQFKVVKEVTVPIKPRRRDMEMLNRDFMSETRLQLESVRKQRREKYAKAVELWKEAELRTNNQALSSQPHGSSKEQHTSASTSTCIPAGRADIAAPSHTHTSAGHPPRPPVATNTMATLPHTVSHP